MSEDITNVNYDVPPVVPVGEHTDLKDDLLQELEDMKQFIVMQSGGYIRKQLFELPGAIKSQSLIIANLTVETEKLGLSIENGKNQALELVLCATEESKPKYSNDKARNLAVQQLLRDDKLYLDSIDEMQRKESQLRREQIQLDYLQNQFKSYLVAYGRR